MKRNPIRLPDQAWFSIMQISQLLKINAQHLRHLVEEGHFSNAVDLRSTGSPRACVRISREAIRRRMNSFFAAAHGAIWRHDKKIRQNFGLNGLE
jgi:hypothetical protein